MKSLAYKTKLNNLISIFFIIITTHCKEPQTTIKPNILLICVDDLRPELRSFGKSYISSPNIDQLANQGFSFHRHYVNAPSCGPSRYTLLTGQFGERNNNALFQRANKLNKGVATDLSMPGWFKEKGYTTISVGKVSHHPGGLGGDDWNDSSIVEMPNAWDKSLMPTGKWQHPRGMMHGLANGEIREIASEMDVYQALKGDDTIYPDGIITNEALDQLKILSKNQEKPFFLAVGIIRPHLPFGAPEAYLDRYQDVKIPDIRYPEKPEERTTWHKSGEFMKYNRWDKNPNDDPVFAEEVRRHYAACVSYADAQVGKLLNELKRLGADKNTIIVLWGDHGWHLGEHAIWGKHSLFEESLRSPLIISYPEMPSLGAKSEAIVQTLDIFPTLCDLAKVEKPAFLQGLSLTEIIENPNKNGHPAIGYWKNAFTVRTNTHRMILHEDDFVELYDHTTDEKETKNIAGEHPKIVEELKKVLADNSN